LFCRQLARHYQNHQPVLDQRDLGLQLSPECCCFGSDGSYIGFCRNLVVNGIKDLGYEVFGGIARDTAIFWGVTR
jgi:hypothetical protein